MQANMPGALEAREALNSKVAFIIGDPGIFEIF